MTEHPYNVLFICTGNSARSILAESLINHWGRGHFKGYSAGSYPKGRVHPFALDLLRSLELPTEALRSKSWEEFAQAGDVWIFARLLTKCRLCNQVKN
jgi:arsenate reductase (thioredoxin)